MGKKDRTHELNLEFLDLYQKAALENAHSLLNEAKLLLSNNYFARAYFLAVASIEETGKAHMAFSSKGRNLSNHALHKTLKEMFEDHSRKIGAAFIGWLTDSKEKEEKVEALFNYMGHLKRGREKSMYVDAGNGNTVTNPLQSVRPVAAKDSTLIAEKCLHFTRKLLLSEPYKTSTFDDKYLCIKGGTHQALLSDSDFGAFLLHHLKTDGQKFNWSKCIVTYHDAYYCRGKKFRNQSDNSTLEPSAS